MPTVARNDAVDEVLEHLAELADITSDVRCALESAVHRARQLGIDDGSIERSAELAAGEADTIVTLMERDGLLPEYRPSLTWVRFYRHRPIR
jgi:hypothetical protein